MSATFEIPDWMITPASPPAAPDLGDVDPHRIEGLVNRFIAAKQNAHYDAPDAFYRHEGVDALQRAPFVRNRLIGLKDRLLDKPWSDFLSHPRKSRSLSFSPITPGPLGNKSRSPSFCPTTPGNWIKLHATPSSYR